MAASIPTGSKFWFDGTVWPVTINGSNDAGTEKFWFDGSTWEGLSPTSVASVPEQWASRYPDLLARHVLIAAAMPAFFAPPDTSAAAEDVTLDKWNPGYPSVLSRQALIAAAMPAAFQPALENAVAVSLDMWASQMAQPDRTSPFVAQGATTWVPVIEAPEDITLDKWLGNAEPRPPKKLLPVSCTPFASLSSVPYVWPFSTYDTPWCGSTGDSLYLQSGQFSSVMKTSLVIGAVDTFAVGISWDGTNTPWAGTSDTKLYLQSGQFDSVLKTSFSVTAIAGTITGISWDSRNTPWCSDLQDKLYLQSGQFDSTLKTSLSIGAVEPTVKDISWDGTNTPWCGNGDSKLYLQSGQFSSTLKTSLLVVSVDGNPTGISWDGTNTLWIGVSDDKLYLQSGQFASTLKTSLSVGAVETNPQGIETNNIDGRLPPAPTDIKWEPQISQPYLLKPRLIGNDGAMMMVTSPFPLPPDQWPACYPDRIDGLRRAADYPSFFQPPADTAMPPTLDHWEPRLSQPCRPVPRFIGNDGASLTSLDDFPVIAPENFLPLYPEAVHAPPRLTEYPSFFSPPGDDVSVVTLDWLPNHPGTIERRVLPTALRPAFFEPPTKENTVIRLDWLPSFPDRLYPLPPLPTQGEMAPVTFLKALPVVAPDGFLPIYPDLIWLNRFATSRAWYHPAFQAQLFTGYDFLHAEWFCSPLLASRIQSTPSIVAEFDASLSLSPPQGTNP